MKRPDGRHWAGPPHSPLLSVTSSRNPFAVIARSVLADQLIPDGALVLLAILASLHRGNDRSRYRLKSLPYRRA